MGSWTTNSFLGFSIFYIFCATYASSHKSLEEKCVANVTKVFWSPDPKENFLYAYLNYSEEQFFGSEEFSIDVYGYFLDLLNTVLNSNRPKQLEVWSPSKFCENKHSDYIYSCMDYIAQAGPNDTSYTTGAGAFYFMYRVMAERKLTLQYLFPNWCPKYDDSESLESQEDQKYWRRFSERKVSVVKEYFYLLHDQVKLKHFNELKTPMQYCGYSEQTQ